MFFSFRDGFSHCQNQYFCYLFSQRLPWHKYFGIFWAQEKGHFSQQTEDSNLPGAGSLRGFPSYQIGVPGTRVQKRCAALGSDLGEDGWLRQRLPVS